VLRLAIPVLTPGLGRVRGKTKKQRVANDDEFIPSLAGWHDDERFHLVHSSVCFYYEFYCRV
jgi:hypothetical protein